jgi:hypothetical protein
MVDDADVAWHSGVNNRTHLGMEIAQPRADTLYTDFQYRTAATIVREWCEKFAIPIVHVGSQTQPGIIGHEETEQGRGIGKSDPGPRFDWNRFMGLVQLQDDQGGPGGPSIGDGFRAFLGQHPNSGEPRHDEAYDLFGNAYVWLTPTATYSKGALLLWRKWLNLITLVSWEPDAPLTQGSIVDFLAAHPEAGTPRHAIQADVFDNRFVWLSASATYSKGALVLWRKWLDAVQLISWEDEPPADAGRPRRLTPLLPRRLSMRLPRGLSMARPRQVAERSPRRAKQAKR